MSVTPIARVRGISPEEFRSRFEEPAVPVIVEGGAKDQPAVSRFDVAYLKGKLGHVELAWKRSRGHQHPDFTAPTVKEMFARETGRFATLLDAITTGPREERAKRLFTGDEKFLLRRRDGVSTTDPDLAPLLEDFALPDFVPAERLFTMWAWFSGPGVRTWLHYDNNGCHNLNAQLTGEKECVLYPPDELAKLGAFDPKENPATNCSRIDVESAPLADVPSFTGTLHAGDLLFLPAWWWHTFRHLGELNANINVWWKPAADVPNATATRQLALDRAAAAR